MLDSADGRQALGALQEGEPPVPPPAVTLNADLKAAIDALQAARPETEIAPLAGRSNRKPLSTPWPRRRTKGANSTPLSNP